ncbi:helix-turn-helix transcriptional regulator [Treponema sp.]|uniref:helix-turn-helix transcriptional regulator n=1 Tax=Treponema sp. TaxID=166 RepID=UPI00298E1C10|nr:WYL domain-containing protein [Treponema sp.]MCQ2241255.1 WYL domain-containing protein [Treponema sp.]
MDELNSKNISNRKVDVVLQVQRILELFSRPGGATVKEVCRELEIDQRTFYRRKDDLEKMDVPLECRSDPDSATNGKRWYVRKDGNDYTHEIKVYLTPAEKMYFRTLVQKNSFNNEIEKSLFDKLNKAVFHDANPNESKLFVEDNEIKSNESLYRRTDPFTDIVDAMENNYAVTLSVWNPKYNIKGLPEDFSDDDFKDKYVEPYALASRHGKTYLLGNAAVNGKFHVLCMPMPEINHVKIQNRQTFLIPKDFSISQFMDRWFPKKENVEIKIRIDNDEAHRISQCEWYDNQHAVIYFDNQVVSFATNQVERVKQTILSLGSKAEILEPEWLRTEVESELKKAQNLYKGFPEYTEAWHNYIDLDINEETNRSILQKRLVTNTIGYRLDMKWWRAQLEKHMTTSIFNFRRISNFCDLLQLNSNPDSKPAYPIHHLRLKDSFVERSHPSFVSFIVYKEKVYLEYAMGKEINGGVTGNIADGFSKMISAYRKRMENWWSDSNDCYGKKILSACGVEKENFEKYSSGFSVLLTGIKSIDPEIARQLTETGKLFDEIPAAAVLFRHGKKENSKEFIESVVFGKF